MADYDLFPDLTAALAAAEAVFAANFGGLMSAVSLDGSNAAKSLHWNKRKLVLMDIDPAKFSDGSDAVAPKTIDEMSVTEKAAACFVLEPLFQSLSEMSTERLEKVAQAFSGGAVTIRVDNAEPILRLARGAVLLRRHAGGLEAPPRLRARGEGRDLGPWRTRAARAGPPRWPRQRRGPGGVKTPIGKIACTRCGGTGIVNLPPEYVTTLKVLGAGAKTATDLYRCMSDCVSPSAANNRLEWLRRHGFVTRERINGKQWAYRLVERNGARK